MKPGPGCARVVGPGTAARSRRTGGWLCGRGVRGRLSVPLSLAVHVGDVGLGQFAGIRFPNVSGLLQMTSTLSPTPGGAEPWRRGGETVLPGPHP